MTNFVVSSEDVISTLSELNTKKSGGDLDDVPPVVVKSHNYIMDYVNLFRKKEFL